MLVYDLEIVKAIPSTREPRLDGIDYCAGWNDHANMGVACLCAYDYQTDRYRVFTEANLADFAKLASERLVIGFNSIGFDDKVVNAAVPEAGNAVQSGYDLLVEMWVAAGLAPTFQMGTHGGFGLDATCTRNLGSKKTGNGALAPVMWQRGEIGAVIDYCMEDVRLTKKLLDRILRAGKLLDPRGSGELKIRRP